MKLAKEIINIIDNIGDNMCMGDRWAKENALILKDTPEPKTKIDKLITDFFWNINANRCIDENNFVHLSELTEKKYLKRLNSLLCSKSKKTTEKRRLTIIHEFIGWDWNVKLLVGKRKSILESILNILKI